MSDKKKLNARQQESYNWWKEVLKKTSSIKASEDYSKGMRKSFKPGNMVAFKYPNPKTPLKTLRYFDKSPLVIIFNIRGSNIFGLNLHWAPRPIRETIIKMVVKINRSNIKSDRRLELAWQDIKEFLRRNGLAHVITKQYIMARIQNMEYIPYTQWKYAASLPTEKFITHSDYSEADVTRLIYGHAKATRDAKNRRFGR